MHNKVKAIFFKILIVLLIYVNSSCNKKNYAIKSKKNYLYEVDSSKIFDKKLVEFYRPQKIKLDSIMYDIVAVSKTEIIKQNPEGPLNNLFADAMFFTAKKWNIKFDFAYTNYDGIRIPLPKGNIYRYKIFELMPFENKMVTLKVGGVQIQNFFDAIAKIGEASISGVNFTIKNKKAINIFINNSELKLDSSYTILTSDYIANGGDVGAMLNDSYRVDTDFLLRDAILEYLKIQYESGIILNPTADGRIKLE